MQNESGVKIRMICTWAFLFVKEIFLRPLQHIKTLLQKFKVHGRQLKMRSLPLLFGDGRFWSNRETECVLNQNPMRPVYSVNHSSCILLFFTTPPDKNCVAYISEVSFIVANSSFVCQAGISIMELDELHINLFPFLLFNLLLLLQCCQWFSLTVTTHLLNFIYCLYSLNGKSGV